MSVRKPAPQRPPGFTWEHLITHSPSHPLVHVPRPSTLSGPPVPSAPAPASADTDAPPPIFPNRKSRNVDPGEVEVLPIIYAMLMRVTNNSNEPERTLEQICLELRNLMEANSISPDNHDIWSLVNRALRFPSPGLFWDGRADFNPTRLPDGTARPYDVFKYWCELANQAPVLVNFYINRIGRTARDGLDAERRTAEGDLMWVMQHLPVPNFLYQFGVDMLLQYNGDGWRYFIEALALNYNLMRPEILEVLLRQIIDQLLLYEERSRDWYRRLIEPKTLTTTLTVAGTEFAAVLIATLIRNRVYYLLDQRVVNNTPFDEWLLDAMVYIRRTRPFLDSLRERNYNEWYRLMSLIGAQFEDQLLSWRHQGRYPPQLQASYMLVDPTRSWNTHVPTVTHMLMLMLRTFFNDVARLPRPDPTSERAAMWNSIMNPEWTTPLPPMGIGSRLRYEWPGGMGPRWREDGPNPLFAPETPPRTPRSNPSTPSSRGSFVPGTPNIIVPESPLGEPRQAQAGSSSGAGPSSAGQAPAPAPPEDNYQFDDDDYNWYQPGAGAQMGDDDDN